MACLTGCFLTEVLVLLGTAIGLGLLYMKHKMKYWQRLDVPTIEPSLPFGNLKDLFLQRSSFGETFTNIYTALKAKGVAYGGAYFFARPVFIPIDPELIKNIMQKDFHHFVDRGFYANEKKEPMSAHLFSLRGTRWRNLRAKLTPTFTSGKMKFMFQTLVDCSDGLEPVMVEESSAGRPIDIKDVVRRYTTDVIGSCAFGIDCNTLKNSDSEFQKQGEKAFSPTTYQALKIFFTFAAPDLMLKLNVGILNTGVAEFFRKVVEETVEYREKNDVQRKDFMNMLLQLKNKGRLDDELATDKSEEVGALSMDQVAAQSFLFYLAGFETSSTTLSFCLFELSQNRALQDKLRQEVNDVLAKHDGKITYDSMMDMKYMDNVIDETLRMYPPVPVLNRMCNEAYTIPGTDTVLPVGTHVFIVNQALQRDPEHFPDPDVFDPDRFTDEVKRTRHHYANLPFGEGPRVCIGQRFGLMQTKVGLTALIKNFKFTLSDKTKTPIVMKKSSFINTVVGGIWLNATKV